MAQSDQLIAASRDRAEAALAAADWHAANQRYLRAALDVVRAHVAGRQGAADREEEIARARHDLELASASLPAPAALDTLCASFGLSPFEREVVLLCAGVELDASFASLLAAAQGDPARPYATFSLALAVLPEAHWSALAPEGALRRWRLVDVGAGSALVFSPLRIDERVLHYLLGVNCLDDRLRGLVARVPSPTLLSPSQEALVERLTRLWSPDASGAEAPAVELWGGETAGKRDVAAAVCHVLGWHLLAMSAHVLPTDPRELEALARLWEREMILSGAALLLDCDELDAADGARAEAVARFLRGVNGPVIISGRQHHRLRLPSLVSLEVGHPTAQEQRMLWHQVLGTAGEGLDGQVDSLAAQFTLEASAMRSAVAEASAGPEAGREALGDRLWEACRLRLRPRLDELAQRVEARVGWEDLVLPAAQLQLLRELAGQVRQRVTVYEDWGLAARSSRGLGISVLFAGASGTGKTLAAEVLASELRLDLYRIDLSQVVSKYIGETEKNLRRVFDAAEDSAAVLLFDEADALFGKRSEVKDSHDRYANIEVSYLLQRMEAYRGLAILTTNMKEALDTAFLRRIRFVVSFPFPDGPHRAEIWRRMFPAGTPTDGLDVVRLARLSIPGGSIRNIALNAAFLAADAGEPVRMAHLLRAARTEYGKLEKPLPASEIGDWVE
jgi:hypothetical protein